MPKYFSQSLPYRRLQKFANGIWDEERKTFYPFKFSNDSPPAKRGIMYYVSNVFLSGINTGDKAATYAAYQATVLGSTLYLAFLNVQATVAASNVNASAQVAKDVNILCDPNTAVTLIANSTSYSGTVIYAEIPADPGGGPVVVS